MIGPIFLYSKYFSMITRIFQDTEDRSITRGNFIPIQRDNRTRLKWAEENLFR